MAIQPLHEKILVRPYPPEAISEGGIVVPDSYKTRPSKAYVVAVGEGVKDRPMKLKVGDTVFHVKNAGTLIDEKEDLYILRDVDCLGYIREEVLTIQELEIKNILHGTNGTVGKH